MYGGNIIVTGDICISTLQWLTLPQNNQSLNWQNHQNLHCAIKPAESLLLARLVALATGSTVCSPQIPDLDNLAPKVFLRSTAELAMFPASSADNDEGKVFRIKRFLGFTGPENGKSHLLPLSNDDPEAMFVIIDDEDNGFNTEPQFWPRALNNSGFSPLIIYKMSNPVGSNALWQHLEQHLKQTVMVINGDDLRAKGVNISRSLSWERTARDFMWQLMHNPNLKFLAKCSHLVVPFGLEGAIYYQNSTSNKSKLYFLPYEFEGGSFPDSLGKMYGLTSCFVAALARRIVLDQQSRENLTLSIGEGIREGIVAAQKYYMKGFGRNVEAANFPNPTIFFPTQHDPIIKEHVQDVQIPDSYNDDCYSCWYILKDKSSANLAEIAYDIVKNGEGKVLKYMPVARFGKLKTVDRTEIESYRSIKNLMWEYISTHNTVRPLSIAVFGTPGSGKSFGIAEVATTIAPKSVVKLNFNLSQFSSVADLSTAFHKVRDLCLEGKLPLVFFDEFDSTFDNKLGWLKYFLAPMQDGIFREKDTVHPIGKAIFVFVGGTANTFSEFCGEDFGDEEKKDFLAEFKSAKGPDFVSRLRGYVNILGPNQTDPKRDQLFIIRRAMLLRSLLETKVPHLINNKDEAQIDTGVLRALLKVPRYKHESRSMEAILEMSMLTQAKKWEQSHLPSQKQLKLHVDEEQFLRHLMHDAFYSERVESIAKALYEEAQKLENTTEAWQQLSKESQEAWRQQAWHIPDFLLKINYDLLSVKEQCLAINFTETELKILAQHEHERRREHPKGPTLPPWEDLSEKQKNRTYHLLKSWPIILANANFKVERLNYVCQCETKV